MFSEINLQNLDVNSLIVLVKWIIGGAISIFLSLILIIFFFIREKFKKIDNNKKEIDCLKTKTTKLETSYSFLLGPSSSSFASNGKVEDERKN